ncbi:MAG: lycopene cyclase family protein [Bacteroidota bacterium]
MQKYDYIFIGAGCAGLSLLTRMLAEGITEGKKILLIDRAPKNINDRTWCFWENTPGFFEPIVYKQWNRLWFHADEFSKQFDIAPYHYKMIRGIDFYNYCFKKIQQQPGIDILYGEISDLSFLEGSLHVKIDDQPYIFSNAIVFNSVGVEKSMRQPGKIHLLQHFKGWIIETAKPCFKTGEATLMDFRVPQTNGTTFVYVLPLSPNKALVEYTLFSEKILADEVYNIGLEHYLAQHLQLIDYTVSEEEFGVIPMTNARFPWYANGMYHIGTAGGQTKASSGYTFAFIQTQSDAIIMHIKDGTLSPDIKPGAVSKRFDFYDAVLLQVLAGKYATGSKVFTSLFKNNSPQSIFAFLDNKSALAADLSLIRTLPAWPFLKAAYKQITGA